MQKILLIVSCMLFYFCLFSQCRSIKFKSSNKDYYTIGDTLHFSTINNCEKSKFILFSLEYFDSTRSWQEVDNDIYVIADKGMKIITLYPKKIQQFIFEIKNIDTIILPKDKEIQFRILCNLYSDNKLEIIQTTTVKQFIISRE